MEETSISTVVSRRPDTLGAILPSRANANVLKLNAAANAKATTTALTKAEEWTRDNLGAVCATTTIVAPTTRIARATQIAAARPSVMDLEEFALENK